MIIIIGAMLRTLALCSALSTPGVTREPIPRDLACRVAAHIEATRGQHKPELIGAIVWGESRGIHTTINPVTAACGPMQVIVSPKRCAWLIRQERRGYVEGIARLNAWYDYCARIGKRGSTRCAVAGFRGGWKPAKLGWYKSADAVLARARNIRRAMDAWTLSPAPPRPKRKKPPTS